MGCCVSCAYPAPPAAEIRAAAPEVPAATLSAYSASNKFKTTDGTEALPIRLASSGPGAMPPMTIMQLFEEILKKGKGDLPALRQEKMADGTVPTFTKGQPDIPSAPVEHWHTLTYQEYYDAAKTVARAYLSIGLERHASVNIWGFNSPEWFLAEIGAIFAGGKAAGIYPTDTAEQILFKIQHSGGQIIAVEDVKKFDKLVNVMDQLPAVKAIVCWAFEPSAEQKASVNCEVLSWAELMARGAPVKVAAEPGPSPSPPTSNKKQSLLEHTDAETKTGVSEPSNYISNSDAESLERQLQARMSEQQPGHCCALIYTSGTTGRPKAVMISHDNIVFESAVVMDLVPTGKTTAQERILSYLPLSHVAGMLLDIISPIFSTARTPSHTTIHFARAYDLSKGTVGNRLRAVRPTLFLGVPRVWEKIQDKIMKVGQKSKGMKKKIALWGKRLGLEHANNCQLGGSGAFPDGYPLASKLVHKKVKGLLGLDQCKFAFTGAAPISVDTLKFFGALGLQINEVYGMSECTGATTWSTDECHIWGSCGYAMPSMEIKIEKVNSDGSYDGPCPRAPSMQDKSEEYQGEICYRGRHIMMGYMANPALGDDHVQTIQRKLDAAIDDDGWLHSGDKGIMTESGMVKITGRYKELLIGAGGENVAPVPIEDAVKAACPAISNIMMFGDRKPFLSAMITLKAKGNPGETRGTNDLDCEIPGSNVKTISAAMTDKTTIKYIEDCIKEGNKAAPNNNSQIRKFTILPYDFSVEGEELTSTLKLKRSVVLEHFAEVAGRFYDGSTGRESYVPYTGTAAAVTENKSAPVTESKSAPVTESKSAPTTETESAPALPTATSESSTADKYSGFEFDSAAKAKTFGKVFDAGRPMWVKLDELVTPYFPEDQPPTKILSVGDGPGEPGCYMAARFKCSTITSDVLPPMVEAAKTRVAKMTEEGKLTAGQVEAKILDIQDLQGIDDGSCDLLTSAHAYPFCPDQAKAIAEANRVLKSGGIFGVVVWKSFELLPLAGQLMGAVTGKPPAAPPAGSPPPPPVAWGTAEVTDKLLSDGGFEMLNSSEDVIEFVLSDLEVAMKYSALPIWDKITGLEESGSVPNAWKKYTENWEKICTEKGHLNPSEFEGFKIAGVYRTIVAKKTS